MKIHDLIILGCKKEWIPTEWSKSIIFPTHKKGEKLDCTNYRGIVLLSTTYKAFTNIVHHRLQPYTENIPGQGFSIFFTGIPLNEM
jgi:hypothetical protein